MVFGTAAGHGHLLFTITFTSASSLWLIRTPAVQPHTVQLVGLDSARCRFSQHLQPRCTRTYLHESSQLLKSTCIKAFVGAILYTSSPDATGAVDVCAIFLSVPGSSSCTPHRSKHILRRSAAAGRENPICVSAEKFHWM